MLNKYIHDIYYKNIIFPEKNNSSCYQNCQKLLLEAQGLNFPELYINSSLSFNFNKKNCDIYSVYESASLLPSFENNVKHFYFDDKLQMTAEVFIQNIEYLEKNNLPVITGADGFYLEYDFNFRKKHDNHPLIMCGYDLDNNEVYLIDFCNKNNFKDSVKLEDFFKARSSNCEPVQNNWAFIDKIQPVNPSLLFKELINTTLKNYYEKDENDYIFKGLDAFLEVKEMLSQSNDINFYKDIFFKLQIISDRYKLFCTSLNSYEKIYNIEGLKNIKCLVEKQICIWDDFFNRNFKDCFNLTENIKNQILEKIEALIQTEILLKTALENL